MTQLSREDLIDHWLLNTAIKFPRPLLHVLPFVRGLTLNAKVIPHCTPEDYAHGLLGLFRSEHLVFTSEDAEDDVQSSAGVDAILKRFLRYPIELVPERHGAKKTQPPVPTLKIPKVEFALSESGGSLWESVANPTWDHFYDQSSDYQTGDAVSPDLTLLMARLGWFPELTSDEGIDIESLSIEEHTEYQILYWKKLPNVFRATFKCRRIEARWKKISPTGDPFEPEWFRRWRSSTVHFYTHPWELSAWPRP
jgi:hypothetical protein